MATDPEAAAIVRLYIERGATRYDGLIPRAALVYFGDSLADSHEYTDGTSLPDALRHPGAPRPAPAPLVEPPLLAEHLEHMLDTMKFTPELKRQVREALAEGLIEQVAASTSDRIDWLEGQLDAPTFNLVLDACEHAGVRAGYHTLPAGVDREACDRALTRWVNLSFAAFFADIMVELAKPGDLRDLPPGPPRLPRGRHAAQDHERRGARTLRGLPRAPRRRNR